MATFFKIQKFIFIVIALPLVATTCRKKDDCKENVYQFQLAIRASPNLDSISLQDTVWFRISQSNQLLDLNTNALVFFKNAANLSLVFAIRKVIGPQAIQDAADSFDYVLKKEVNITSVNPARLREFKLVEKGNHYQLVIGFLPKTKGVFRVLTENAANVYKKENNCEKASFSLKYADTDQHFYLGYNISGDGVYYFKVY